MWCSFPKDFLGEIASGGASPPHGEKIQTQEAMPEFSETGVDRVWMLCGIHFCFEIYSEMVVETTNLFIRQFLLHVFCWWCYVIIGYKALTGGTCRKNMKKVLGFPDMFQKKTKF